MGESNDSWVGLKLSGGRYGIETLLGEGSKGFAYRARDRNLNINVVIKAPRRALLENPEFAHRFGREILSLVELTHPHIVKILDAGEHDGVPYAVMQCLTGGSLNDRRVQRSDGRSAPLSPSSLSDWLPAIAKALDFVHSRKIVHRDVKPGNILFDQHGNAYLSDFGIAKALASASETGARQTATTSAVWNVVGMSEYTALELIMGQPYDGRSDQYALAVTVYELLAGRRPFMETGAALMVRLGQAVGPPELHSVCPAVSEGVSRAIHRGLARDPKQRYPTCTAFASAVLGAVDARVDPRVAIPTIGERVIAPCPACGKHVAVLESAQEAPRQCSHCNARFRLSPDRKSLLPVLETPGGGDAVLLNTLGIKITQPPPLRPAPSRSLRPGGVPAMAKGEGATSAPTSAPPGGREPAAMAPHPTESRPGRSLPWLKVAIGTALFAGVFLLATALAMAVRRPGGGKETGSDLVVSSRSSAADRPVHDSPAETERFPQKSFPLPPSLAIEPIRLLAIEPQTVFSGERLKATARVKAPREPGPSLRFRIGFGAPAGTDIDPSSGVITWTPRPDHAPATYTILVVAFDPDHSAFEDRTSFDVHLREKHPASTLSEKVSQVSESTSEEKSRPTVQHEERVGPDAPKPVGPRTLIDEDFRNVTEGELPKGWDSPLQKVAMKRQGEPGLAVVRPSERGQLVLPAVDLAGDFTLDLAFSVPSNFGTAVSIGLELEGKSKLALHVLGDGSVQLNEKRRLKGSRLNGDRSNRLQVIRHGKALRLLLNGGVVNGLSLDYLGTMPFKTVRLSLGAENPAEAGARDRPEDLLFRKKFVAAKVAKAPPITASPRILQVRLESSNPGS